MRSALRNPPTSRTVGPDALIKEARRRQRIRYLLTAGALLAVCGTVTGLYATLRSNAGPPPRSPRSVQPSPGPTTPLTAPRLPLIAAKVLMWPLGYPLGVGNYAGPPFVIDDLRTRHYLQTGKINLCCGDYQPLMIIVGRWLVYAGNGATAIRTDLRGRPRVLGRTALFAPSATPGHVWLVYPGAPAPRIRQVRVDGGRAGSPDHAAREDPARSWHSGRAAVAESPRPTQAMAARPGIASPAWQPQLGKRVRGHADTDRLRHAMPRCVSSGQGRLPAEPRLPGVLNAAHL
jgi:hypothetical protein